MIMSATVSVGRVFDSVGSTTSITGSAYEVTHFSSSSFVWPPTVTRQNSFLPMAGTVVQLIISWLRWVQPNSRVPSLISLWLPGVHTFSPSLSHSSVTHLLTHRNLLPNTSQTSYSIPCSPRVTDSKNPLARSSKSMGPKCSPLINTHWPPLPSAFSAPGPVISWIMGTWYDDVGEVLFWTSIETSHGCLSPTPSAMIHSITRCSCVTWQLMPSNISGRCL